MSRFSLTTLVAVTCLVAAACLLEPPGRWVAMGVVAGLYVVVLGAGIVSVRLGFFVDAYCRGDPGRKQVALTFDDGPDPEATPPLLDLLRERGVPAAFFCIGERAAAHPAIVRRMAEEGHVVGNHTARHAWWTNFLFGRRLHEQLARAQETLGGITGSAPRYFRPPVGLTNPDLRRALDGLALTLVGWDVRPFDRGARPEAVVGRVARRTRDGSIIVLHDGNARPEALLRIVAGVVDELLGRGYAFVSLDELRVTAPRKDTE